MRLCGVDVVQTETGTWEKCSERKKTGKLAPPDINGLKPNLVCDHLRPKPSWSTKSADRGGGNCSRDIPFLDKKSRDFHALAIRVRTLVDRPPNKDCTKFDGYHIKENKKISESMVSHWTHVQVI